MATDASRRAEWRTSTHGRYKPRASYRCLVPDSDIEMCEVSYHQEQASINALNKNISFCTALLPRCQKDPFPPHPLAWASCVRVFCANLIYFFEKQHFLAFFICKSPSENRSIGRLLSHDNSVHIVTTARSESFCMQFFDRKRSEYLVVTEKMRTFAIA